MVSTHSSSLPFKIVRTGYIYKFISLSYINQAVILEETQFLFLGSGIWNFKYEGWNFNSDNYLFTIDTK